MYENHHFSQCVVEQKFTLDYTLCFPGKPNPSQDCSCYQEKEEEKRSPMKEVILSSGSSPGNWGSQSGPLLQLGGKQKKSPGFFFFFNLRSLQAQNYGGGLQEAGLRQGNTSAPTPRKQPPLLPWELSGCLLTAAGGHFLQLSLGLSLEVPLSFL